MGRSASPAELPALGAVIFTKNNAFLGIFTVTFLLKSSKNYCNVYYDPTYPSSHFATSMTYKHTRHVWSDLKILAHLFFRISRPGDNEVII